MKKTEKPVLIVIAIVILALAALSGCGKGEGESAEKRISFHDLSFVCPEGYVYDKESSDKDSLYYKVYDDDGNILKSIYFKYTKLDEPGNILKPENAEDYCNSFADDDSVHDYDGYEIVDYNDELSAIEFTMKMDSDEDTYNCAVNAFCDDSGGIYTLMVGSLGDDSLEDLNAVINTMKYTFDVFPAGADEEEPDDGSDESDDGSKEGSDEDDKEEDGSGSKDETEVSPEFKEMMDSYEAFFDEYVEFMKKYQNSSDTAALLTEYADYMTKYADYMQKLEALDESEMTVAEAAYYTKVNARIMKKLAEIA